ncbi:MAG: hypothetical protein KGL46_04440 [Hyphomicrobiales bacterium]|nr:hypothetical protein [Hyphomicrobiales bacterium]
MHSTLYAQDDHALAAAAARRTPWVALGAALMLGMALVGLRNPVTRLVPRAAGVYAAVGLPVNLVGFALSHVGARIVMDESRRILIVDGDMANAGAVTLTAPLVKVSVRGPDGAQIYTWSARPPKQQFGPGEKAAFIARLAAPPVDGADVVVEFDQPRHNASATPKTPARARAHALKLESHSASLAPHGSSSESQ